MLNTVIVSKLNYSISFIFSFLFFPNRAKEVNQVVLKMETWEKKKAMKYHGMLDSPLSLEIKAVSIWIHFVYPGVYHLFVGLWSSSSVSRAGPSPRLSGNTGHDMTPLSSSDDQPLSPYLKPHAAAVLGYYPFVYLRMEGDPTRWESFFLSFISIGMPLWYVKESKGNSDRIQWLLRSDGYGLV